MSYHATLGNRDVAMRIAKHWMRYVLRAEPSTSSYYAAARSGSALFSAGNSDEHLVAYRKAFEIAEQIQAPQNMVLSAHRMALSTLNAGDTAAFDEWVSIAVEVNATIPSGRLSALVHSLMCRQAIERGLPIAAAQHFEAFEKYGGNHSLQDRRSLLCLRGAIGMLQADWHPDEAFLQELSIVRARLAHFGQSDYATSTTARLLQRVGRIADAQGLLVHYLTSERREIRALSAHLQESARRLGLDPSPYVRPIDA
jgi:hypothetical protein